MRDYSNHPPHVQTLVSVLGPRLVEMIEACGNVSIESPALFNAAQQHADARFSDGERMTSPELSDHWILLHLPQSARATSMSGAEAVAAHLAHLMSPDITDPWRGRQRPESIRGLAAYLDSHVYGYSPVSPFVAAPASLDATEREADAVAVAAEVEQMMGPAPRGAEVRP